MNTSFNRRNFLIGGAACFSPALSFAQPKRIIGVLFRGFTEIEHGLEDHFAIQRIPVDVKYINVARDLTKMPSIVEMIKREKPDLVYSWGTSVTLSLVGEHDSVDRNKHITDIPVVFTLVTSPVSSKIIPTFNASKRNVVGISHMMSAKSQLRAMMTYKRAKTIGMIYTPTEKNSLNILEDVKHFCAEEQIYLFHSALPMKSSTEIDVDKIPELIGNMKDFGVKWLYMPPDSGLGTISQRYVVPEAHRNLIPTFATTEQLMQTGTLAGLFSSYYDMGLQTGRLAQRILDGTPISTTPSEYARTFSYQINMDAARKMNMPPPITMMNYAKLI